MVGREGDGILELYGRKMRKLGLSASGN